MAIAISQVHGFIVFVLILLVFWIKLRMEEQWMRSQFGEAYATYLIRPLPCCLTFSERCVTISAPEIAS